MTLPRQSTSVLVIGAGPAGLALSRHLGRSQIPHLLVERGGTAASWSAMPTTLRLVSPWWTNALTTRDLVRHPPFSMVSCREYASYLAGFRERFRIEVHEDREVLEIERDLASGKFRVNTTKGTVEAPIVVSATGYFSRPAGPSPGYPDDGSIPIIHAAKYPGPQAVRTLVGDAPTVIVGRRVSAGQLMVELHDNGVDVALSTKARVEFRRDGFYGAVKDLLYYFYEEALIGVRPRLQLPSFPVMDGGRARKLVESGLIGLHGPIRDVAAGCITFRDGSTLRAGLIINATGYHPAFPSMPNLVKSLDSDGLPICDGWESIDCPGLFFLGLDNRINYRSRTIRGIRRDSSFLAKVIQRRVLAAVY